MRLTSYIFHPSHPRGGHPPHSNLVRGKLTSPTPTLQETGPTVLRPMDYGFTSYPRRRFMCLCLKKTFRYRKVIAWFAAELMSRPEEEKIVNSETIFVFYWTLTLINLKASFDARSSLHSLMKKVFVLFSFVLRYIFNHYSDTFTEILLYFVSVWQLAKIALLPCLIDQCGCQAQTHRWTFQVLQHLF